MLDEIQALDSFAALSQPTRLQMLRVLVVAGSAGMAAGAVGEAVNASSSTASFHLAHLERMKDKLSPDSQRRLAINPLRVLDSKHPMDQEAISTAPSILDHLVEADRAQARLDHIVVAADQPVEQEEGIFADLEGGRTRITQDAIVQKPSPPDDWSLIAEPLSPQQPQQPPSP